MQQDHLAAGWDPNLVHALAFLDVVPTDGWLAELHLVDHHCHGVVEAPLDRATFEDLITESDAPADNTVIDRLVVDPVCASKHGDALLAEDAVEALIEGARRVLAFFEPLDEAAVAGVTYAPGKWTVKEVLGHVVDVERVFAGRALRLARRDSTPLPGFDENAYVAAAGFEERPLADLVAEYKSVRRGSITFFAGLPEEAWQRRGRVDDYAASVRGLAFHVAGHELHHLRILRERYPISTG